MRNAGKLGISNSASLLVFLAWILYTVSYFGKVNFSANITQIMDFYQISKAEAGMVPSFFFFSYGIGQVVNGFLCKKYNIKWMIFFSLLTSAMINFVVALTTEFGIVKWLWLVNGFVLSLLWPTLVRLISEMLPQRDLGGASVIMGTTVAAGTLVIYSLSSVYANFNMFKLAFYTAAVADAAVAVLWLMLYKKAARKAYCERAKELTTEPTSFKGERQRNNHVTEKILVMTIGLTCMYAIIVNLTKDGLTTWVPSILKDEFSLSDWLSILLTLALPIIAVFGNAFALEMHKKVRDYITHCFLVFIAVGVFVLSIIATITLKQMVLTLFGLIIVNFLASSLNNLITSIFPIFMRDQVNSGLLAGVLNGFCYIGSALSSYGLGVVADTFGWISVFWVLFGCCVLCCFAWGAYHLIKKRIKKSDAELS